MNRNGTNACQRKEPWRHGRLAREASGASQGSEWRYRRRVNLLKSLVNSYRN